MYAIFGLCMGTVFTKLVAHEEYFTAILSLIAIAVVIYLVWRGD